MNSDELTNLAWDKMNGLIPVIVQNDINKVVLMMGYMDKTALETTVRTKWVTFFSRSKNCLWVKGETSGNKLALVNIITDCDSDALLVMANPLGPTCHLGNTTCFGEIPESGLNFLASLENIIHQRLQVGSDNSYTVKLLEAGAQRIAQKIGEESIEVVIAAVSETNEKLCAEVADLLFHLLVLLQSKKLRLADVIKVLKSRAT